MRKTVLVVCAAMASALCHASYYRYISDAVLDADGLYLVDVDTTVSSLSLEVRAALHGNGERAGYSRTSWSLVWNYTSSENYYYASVRCGNTDFGDFTDRRFAEVTVGKISMGADSVIVTKRFEKGVDTAEGYNSFLMEWKEGKSRIFIGNKELQHVSSVSAPSGINGRCGVMSRDSLTLSSVVVETKPDLSLPLETEWTADAIAGHIAHSADKIEGYWEYLDRDNDEKRAKPGGRYTVAAIKDGDGYLLLYVDGAEVNESRWRTGMIKGRLLPTAFVDHYNLVWYDSMMLPIGKDVHADITDGAILSLEFPLYNTKIRFSKVPKNPGR